MFAQWLHHPHVTRLQARFAARRPRNAFARVLVALVGVALLLVLLVVGAVLGVAMLVGATMWRALRQRGRPQAAPQGQVIEGEYRHARHGVLPHPN